ncbi:MAG: hypothetical protein H7338_22970 [Candidatus Sericytochromatia bacterium]|nr:hypothetical protein [Candidatus Sericytochromatia bacterium]
MSNGAAESSSALSVGERPAAPEAELLAFFEDLGNLPASSVMRVVGHYMIAIEGHSIVASGAMLADLLRSGRLNRDTALLRSLLVYEAALEAQLRQSVARTILSTFAAAAERQGVTMAMQDAFVNIALACEVEAYVNHQKGLATDIRQVAEYSQTATDNGTDEAAVDENQVLLDDGLHAFTDAIADARETGDYTTAYDAQQVFFQRSATVTGTDYWRTRAKTRGQDVALAQTMENIARKKKADSGGFGLAVAAGLAVS